METSKKELADVLKNFAENLDSDNFSLIKKHKEVIKQLKAEKRYYIITLSFLCMVLAGLLFWSLEIREPEHNFDCEIVINEKKEGKWL